MTDLRVVLLAGGVGGAKLADGLAQLLDPACLTIIGNTGDDFTHLGLTICPDLDTLMYTLAGAANPETGWGRADETWRVMQAVRALGGPDWFNLGDADLGTHLVRTHRLRQGATLTAVTAELCRALGVGPTLLPAGDRPMPTQIETAEGEVLPFQEWFVKARWQPVVRAVRLPDDARATPQVVRALQTADLVIIAPSNPFVSIDPILNAYPLRPVLADECDVVIAVSPIIAGEAVKGPTAAMMRAWGMPATPQAVADYYGDVINAFVYDERDAATTQIADLPTLATQTWMRQPEERVQLARAILAFGRRLLAQAS